MKRDVKVHTVYRSNKRKNKTKRWPRSRDGKEEKEKKRRKKRNRSNRKEEKNVHTEKKTAILPESYDDDRTNPKLHRKRLSLNHTRTNERKIADCNKKG